MVRQRTFALLVASLAVASAQAGTVLIDSFDDAQPNVFTSSDSRYINPGLGLTFLDLGRTVVFQQGFGMGSASVGGGVLSTEAYPFNNLELRYGIPLFSFNMSNWTHLNVRATEPTQFFNLEVEFTSGLNNKTARWVLGVGPGESSFALDPSDPSFQTSGGFDPVWAHSITMKVVGAGDLVIDHISATTSEGTSVGAVPEPFTMGLAALGLGVALKRRRREILVKSQIRPSEIRQLTT